MGVILSPSASSRSPPPPAPPGPPVPPRAGGRRPAWSRKSRAIRCSGTMPKPTSLETRIAGPVGAAHHASNSSIAASQVLFVHHQVGQPGGQAFHQHQPARPGLPRQGGREGQRLLHRHPAVRRPVGAVPGDALCHLRIHRLGGGEIDDLQSGLPGEHLGPARLAGPGAAQDQGEAGQRAAAVPSRAVDSWANMPPLPWARPMVAPSTCRSPHSPRSCRTASMVVKMPSMPGWVQDSPPP